MVLDDLDKIAPVEGDDGAGAFNAQSARIAERLEDLLTGGVCISVRRLARAFLRFFKFFAAMQGIARFLCCLVSEALCWLIVLCSCGVAETSGHTCAFLARVSNDAAVVVVFLLPLRS